MTHIITVHWECDRWVDIQLRYLQEHLREPYKIYAFLSGLDEKHTSKYFYATTAMVREHAVKLNLLADMVMLHATSPDDILMFIDGDAFPIGDVMAFVREKLRTHPLVAIQRKENYGDIQPHPAFCVTTVRFWKEISGDWSDGYRWQNTQDESVTDIGGTLLGILEAQRITWYPMLRSNKYNLHPLWFGIYADLIYHHGAGFRAPFSRFDVYANMNRKIVLYFKMIDLLPAPIQSRLPRDIRDKFSSGNVLFKHIVAKSTVLSQQVYSRILRDPLFYQEFQQPPS